MRKILRLAFWFIFTFSVIYTSMSSDIPCVLNRTFMYENLLNPSKLFLNVSLTFSVFIFLRKNLYQNPMVITRAKGNLVFRIFKNGLLISLSYTIVLFFGATIIALLSDGKIHISFVFDIFLLFFYTLHMYLLCYLIYSACNNWSVANIAIVLIHIIVLGVTISFEYNGPLFSNVFFYIALSIMWGGGLILNVNNKDYLQ